MLGFVAMDLGTKVPRSEIGCVGFDEESLRRNVAHHVAKVQASTFVTDPSGNSQMEIQVEIGSRVVGCSRKAMDNARRDAITIPGHQVEEGRMCVSFV